ncbi:MAG: glycosyltransferase family A protein [Gemmatimonadota bacterium]|nr:glycosyltransferase family A protein [Gemmatimonadota bacterium]
MISSRPLVSVCIPTRDRAGHLREALESVLAEDVGEMEVLVLDDASTDHTAAVAREMDDGRVIYHRHATPIGIAANRNACLEAARGVYLAWLDDDDAYLPGGLARQIETLEREPEVALAHASVEVVDAEGRPQPAWRVPFESDTIETGAEAFEELLLRNYVHAPTAVTRASAHRTAGPYATSLGDRAEDWDAWLRLSLVGDVAYAARPAARYRRHGGSATATRGASLEWLESETRVVRRALQRGRGRVPDFRTTRRLAYAALASRHLEAASDALVRGAGSTAARAARRAARLAPSMACELAIAADHASRGDEHGFHEATHPMLRRLARVLANTRYGATVQERVDSTEAWSTDRARVARRIRRVVPHGARIAAIDKWDPSLLHDSRRDGWHFPDLALAPDGYPADDAGAIEHLEAQRSRGADFLVIPGVAFWWLDHYAGFARHLDTRFELVWSDDACVIYRLARADEQVA